MYGKEHLEAVPINKVFFDNDQLLKAAKFLHANNKCGYANKTRSLLGWIELITSYIRDYASSGYWCIGTGGFMIMFEEAGNGIIHADIYVNPADIYVNPGVGDEYNLLGHTTIEIGG